MPCSGSAERPVSSAVAHEHGCPGTGSERSDTPGSRVLYADHLVSINGDSITFHSYSFPHKASRRVAFTDINHLMVLEPSLTNGRWRIWGSGDLCTWFPLDVHRSSRDRIFIATLKTRGMNIGFTVEDSSRVLSIFKEHGLIGGSRERNPSPVRDPHDPFSCRQLPHGGNGLFAGKAGFSARYRRGYPPGVFDALVSRFALTPLLAILDSGNGTGNVAIPLAEQGFHIHAIDPEPEMLAEGSGLTSRQSDLESLGNITDESTVSLPNAKCT